MRRHVLQRTKGEGRRTKRTVPVWKPGREPRPSNQGGSIGIGVITYQRPALLRECIRAVRRNTAMPFSLCVADDGGSDETADWCRGEGLPVITGRNRGVAWNKNRALRFLIAETDCDPIFLLEDDCHPVQHGWEQPWLAALHEFGWEHLNFTAPPWPDGSSPLHVASETLLARGPFSLGELQVLDRLGAALMVMTRKCVDEVGYLDPRFTGYGYGHIDYTQRAAQAGAYPTQGHPTIRDGGLALRPCASFRTELSVRRNRQILATCRRERDSHRRERWRDEREEAAVQHEQQRANWSPRARQDRAPDRISIICPVLDRPDLTARMYQSFAAGGGGYEVVFVDSGSTAENRRWLDSLEALPTRVVDVDGPGSGQAFNYCEAINRGALAARGDILLIVNNDVELTCDPLELSERLRGLYARFPDLGVVYGDLGGPWAAWPAPEAPDWQGCCWAISRRAFEAMGGLEESLTGYGSDELVTRVRMLRLGFRGVRLQGWTYRHRRHATYGEARDRRNFGVALQCLGYTPQTITWPDEEYSVEPVLATMQELIEREELDAGVSDLDRPARDGQVAIYTRGGRLKTVHTWPSAPWQEGLAAMLPADCEALLLPRESEAPATLEAARGRVSRFGLMGWARRVWLWTTEE